MSNQGHKWMTIVEEKDAVRTRLKIDWCPLCGGLTVMKNPGSVLHYEHGFYFPGPEYRPRMDAIVRDKTDGRTVLEHPCEEVQKRFRPSSDLTRSGP